MRKWGLRILKLAYVGLIASLPVYAMANYAATVGAGTNFGSVVVGGVHFASQLLCDMTVANQCATVSAGGALSTTVTGNVAQTVAAGANVTEGNTTDAACAGDNTSGCTIESRLIRIAQNLTTVDTDIKASIPVGTNTIGNVNSAPNVTATACSATVVTGNTAVNAFTAQTTLHGFTIANIDTSEVMWISFTTTAAASGTDSYPLAPATATTFAGLSSFTSPTGFGLNHALSVVAATNGHKFSCTWW